MVLKSHTNKYFIDVCNRFLQLSFHGISSHIQTSQQGASTLGSTGRMICRHRKDRRGVCLFVRQDEVVDSTFQCRQHCRTVFFGSKVKMLANYVGPLCTIVQVIRVFPPANKKQEVALLYTLGSHDICVVHAIRLVFVTVPTFCTGFPLFFINIFKRFSWPLLGGFTNVREGC